MTIETIDKDEWDFDSRPNQQILRSFRKKWDEKSYFEDLLGENNKNRGGRRKISRRIFRRDHRQPIPTTGISLYQPPSPLSSSHGHSNDAGPPVLDDCNLNDPETPEYAQVPELFYDVPARRSISDIMRAKDPFLTTSVKKSDAKFKRTITRQDNPAKDLAGLCSYGLFCCQCVRTQEVGIIENFGNFQQLLLEPGFYCIPWPFTVISGRLSLRIQQQDVVCETKTKDDVFVNVSVAVQYRVIPEKTFDAYYRLTNPRIQIQSYVFDVIRSTVPKMELDDIFESKSTIALEVLRSISQFMNSYGYEIINALVVDILPDERIIASMNEINEWKRLKEAIIHKAESSKIQRVKEAEAHCESLYLSGVGLAKQRMAISKGLHSSVNSMILGSDMVNSDEVMHILLLTQYFDMITSIGGGNLLLEHNPRIVTDMRGTTL